MFFTILNHNFKYELEKVARAFLPFEKIVFSEPTNCFDDVIETKIEQIDDEIMLYVSVKLLDKAEIRTKKIPLSQGNDGRFVEKELAKLLYNCFSTLTGYELPWGILTGIRPAKLFGQITKKSSSAEALSFFMDEMLVSPKKAALCLECYSSEEEIINKSKEKDFSLYISIPFCPSRCSYCSFVSHSVEQAKLLIPDYVKLLCQEIEKTGEIVKQLNLNLKTVYIGGGTPTSISAEQLASIMSAIKNNFNLNNAIEYTVEAGRPDTITEEKLMAIKNNGAGRISINPQTFNDEVLQKIGRKHTADQAVEAFNLARKCGFDNINMDLIAGLEGDTVASFEKTIEKVISLEPENVTVHSLSMKRASNLTKSNVLFEINQGKDASNMVDFAKKALKTNGLEPYYMYRQSKTVGNLENVGYAKKGYEGFYNVYIMDETHTILACGASAVTKLKNNDGAIERIFNYKYPYEYVSGFDEMIKRKQKIVDFYSDGNIN